MTGRAVGGWFNPEQERLILLAMAGDTTAMWKLLDWHGKFIRARCIERLNDQTQVDDAVNDVGVAAVEPGKCLKIGKPEYFQRWLRDIIYQVTRRLNTTGDPGHATPHWPIDPLVPQGGKGEVADYATTRAAVKAACDQLDPLDVMMILLRDEGYSYQEIAKEIKRRYGITLSANAIKQRVSKARQALNRLLGDENEDNS